MSEGRNLRIDRSMAASGDKDRPSIFAKELMTTASRGDSCPIPRQRPQHNIRRPGQFRSYRACIRSVREGFVESLARPGGNITVS